jgi:hypothetical protein
MAHVTEPGFQITGVSGEVESWTVSRDLSGGTGPWTPGGVAVGGGDITFTSDRTPWKAPAITTGTKITIDARADVDGPFSRIGTMVSRTASASTALFDSRSITIADDLDALRAPMPTAPSVLPSAPVDASQAIVEVCQKAGIAHDVEASGIMLPALILLGRTGW